MTDKKPVSSDIDSGPLGLLTRYPVEVAEITALEEQNFNNKENRKVNWELFLGITQENFCCLRSKIHYDFGRQGCGVHRK